MECEKFRSPNLVETISSDFLFFSGMLTEYEFANINSLNVNLEIL